MKNNKKKILIYSILGVVTLLIVTLTITYAYWILTRQQTGENVVNTACLNISFTGENDITLDKAYPMNPEQLENFLSTETPYHFTIHNECNDLASASINLESLTVSGKALEDEYIDAILYEDDYNSNLNSIKKLTSDILNDENKVISDAKHAYSLYNFNLKPDETRDFNLLLYMDPQTPMVDANMNASWKGKITLSTGYKVDSKAIRQISYNDSNGMWGYKDKLTKIVIEDTKSVKEAPEGGKVYGPFDESEYGTKAVESYVVCEADDTNCIGYLQSDDKLIANIDSSYLFADFSNVIKIENLNKLYTNSVENMSSMFSGCSSLTTLDLSSFDVYDVKSVGGMFSNCKGLTELNLSNWKFNNNISAAFTGVTGINTCSSLEKLILDDVDTSQVTNMVNMFTSLNNSPNLTTLDLSDFDTSNVTNMSSMFAGSSSLQTLDLSMFDTSHVTNAMSIFSGAAGLTDLNISNWDLSHVSVSSSLDLFVNDNNLLKINMTNFKFPSNCSNFFGNLRNLNTLILDNADTSRVTNMYNMFSSCSSLVNLDLSSFDTDNVTNMSGMFTACSSLSTLDLSSFKNPLVINMTGMFAGCSSLDSLDLSSFDTSNLSSIGSMFGSCTNLQELNLSNWKFNDYICNNFSNNTLLSQTTSISKIILNNVDTSNVTNMSTMFAGLNNLNSLDLSYFNTSNVTNMENMFAATSNLKSITFGSNFVHKNDASTSGMFAGCPAPERPTGDSWTDVSFD